MARQRVFLVPGPDAGHGVHVPAALLQRGGFSAYCAEAAATTLALLAAPADLTAVALGGSRVRLTWTDAGSDETGFRVERKTGDGSWVEVRSVAADTVSYTDGRLSPGTVYTYRVRALGHGRCASLRVTPDG